MTLAGCVSNTFVPRVNPAASSELSLDVDVVVALPPGQGPATPVWFQAAALPRPRSPVTRLEQRLFVDRVPLLGLVPSHPLPAAPPLIELPWFQ